MPGLVAQDVAQVLLGKYHRLAVAFQAGSLCWCQREIAQSSSLSEFIVPAHANGLSSRLMLLARVAWTAASE